jgi:hypothetical protein
MSMRGVVAKVVLAFAACEMLASDWSDLLGWLFGGGRDTLGSPTTTLKSDLDQMKLVL